MNSQQLIAKLRSSSVAVLVTSLIVITVSVVIGLLGGIGYHYFSERQRDDYDHSQEIGADQFQISVAPALWSLNFPMVTKLMQSPLRDPRVQGVVIKLDDRSLTMARQSDGSIDLQEKDFDGTGLIVKRRALDYEGQALGEVQIYSSTKILEQELRSALTYISILVILVDIILLLALFFALRQIILRPLQFLERYANGIADGGSGVSDTLQNMRFRGELESLKHSIAVMVSELEARNLKLIQSTARFERIIRLFPSPIALFDHSGTMSYLNQRFGETFGYALEDIPNMTAWAERAFPDPDYRRQAVAVWQKERGNAIARDKFIRPNIYEVRCKDGTVKSIEVSGILAADLNISVLNDVTERIRAEQELERYREHLEELVATRTHELEKTYRRLEETEFAMNHAGISIQWIDANDGHFLYVNERACELYGYSREQLLGMQAAEISPDFASEALHRLVPELRLHGQLRIESVANTAGSGKVPIETVLYLQRSVNEQTGHFITFTTDITQRKAAEEALLAAKAAAEAAARVRSEFLANMSHEIRTPMNAIIGMSQLALRTDLDVKQRNYIEKVNQSASSLLSILNDILDFSKVEAGRLEIEKVEFRLDTVVDNLCNVISLRANEKDLEFLLDIGADVPRALVGDPTRLGQILVNLAGNAIKFTERGAIIVGCHKIAEDDNSVTLEFFVRDSGIGMTEEQVSRLFVAFSQVDNSISRRFGGTGLGLAISKRLVELLDGEISVSSQPGKGSVFTFSARFGLAQGEVFTWGGVPLPKNLSDSKVLVVDDNPEAREIFSEIIKNFGFEVHVAASAREASALMADTFYDLLICDWKMPEMDGVQFIRSIQNDPSVRPPMAVIMVSAYGVEELRQESADLVLAGILPKPASPSTIFDMILTALGQPVSAQQRPEGFGFVAGELFEFSGEAVLLVEDNPINQELANDLLTSAGLSVTVANNGRKALEWLDKATFSCVLMDVQMPEMDGLEATRRIRLDPRFKHLPVIAMTAGAMAEEREETVKAGMNGYITKPIDVAKMFSTITKWIKRGGKSSQAKQAEEPESGVSCPDLDVEFGLKSVFNKLTLYRKLLRTYSDESEATMRKFDEALKAGNRKEIKTLAHTLKGSSGTLGMHEVYEAAANLEKADPEADQDQLEVLVEILKLKQQRSIVATGRYLAAN